MNDDSTSNPIQSRMPSEEQVDSLLRDFFRLEVPVELKRPLRRNPHPIVALSEVRENREALSQSRTVRLVAVSMSVAAMTLAVLVLTSGNSSPHKNPGTTADRKSDATSTVTDKRMLVSPRGESRSSSTTITPDGVTLEEADSIKIHQ